MTSGYLVTDKSGQHTHPVRYADIAVLVRTNENVMATAAALQKAGIPSATAQPGLLATPVATLTLACLRRLNDPNDTLATAEIVSLVDCTEPETWITHRLQHLAAGGDPASWKEVGTVEQPPHPVLVQIAVLRRQLSLLAPREALHVVRRIQIMPSPRESIETKSGRCHRVLGLNGILISFNVLAFFKLISKVWRLTGGLFDQRQQALLSISHECFKLISTQQGGID